MNYTLYRLKKEKEFYLRKWEYLFFSKKNKSLPDFLIIGAQKAGTTWLYNILKQNDSIYFPEIPHTSDPTEVRYFDERFFRSLNWYVSLYKDGSGKLKGDKTPKYYLLPPKKISFIKALMPDVKIIFILRNPVDRAWSQAVMNIKRFHNLDYTGNEVVYKKFIEGNLRKGYYSRYIANWKAVFPDHQFKLLLYDDIRQNPLRFLEEITTFLKCDRMMMPEKDASIRYNSNPPLEIPKEIAVFLQKVFKEEINVLQKKYHLSVDTWRYG